MDSHEFRNGKTYLNAYFISVDAVGHSEIVRHTPQDKAAKAFDRLYEQVKLRLKDSADECETYTIWSWLGDGGLAVIYDAKESKAAQAAIEFGRALLETDLPGLQSDFQRQSIPGELQLRIAIHKGSIKYPDEGGPGSIHSTDINFGAHLEKETPSNSVSISEDIYDICDRATKDLFTKVGVFEDRTIYMFSLEKNERMRYQQWIATHGFGTGVKVIAHYQRPSQAEKASLFNAALAKATDFGTTLDTCSSYLVTTERPMTYHDAAVDFIQRGGVFTCYLLRENSYGARQLEEIRQEDVNGEIKRSLERFTEFKNKLHDNNKDSFQVFQFDSNPNLAALMCDCDFENGLCLFSPYEAFGCGAHYFDRADMPHFLVTPRNGTLYAKTVERLKVFMDSATRVI